MIRTRSQSAGKKLIRSLLALTLCTAIIGIGILKLQPVIVEAASKKISETFETDTRKGTVTGNAKLTLSQKAYKGKTSIYVSKRTDPMDSYSYDVSEFAGENLSISAYMRVGKKNLIGKAVLKYTIDGNETHRILVNKSLSKNKFTKISAMSEIPAGAEASIYFATNLKSDKGRDTTNAYYLDNVTIKTMASEPKSGEADPNKANLYCEDGTIVSFDTTITEINLNEHEYVNIGELSKCKGLTTVYFGRYPQDLVTGSNLTKSIKQAKYDSYGDGTVNGIAYRRLSGDMITDTAGEGLYDWPEGGYQYFKYRPIVWRVLSVGENELFLVAEKNLDDQLYNDEYINTTWSECTLRAWLNNDFYTKAFYSRERELIKKVTIKNEGNQEYGIDGGSDTEDKIFLLSMSEVTNDTYGFTKDYEETDKRVSKNTDYANTMGGGISNDNPGCWWLRTPGYDSDIASYVYSDGYIITSGSSVDSTSFVVRPAIKLNLEF